MTDLFYSHAFTATTDATAPPHALMSFGVNGMDSVSVVGISGPIAADSSFLELHHSFSGDFDFEIAAPPSPVSVLTAPAAAHDASSLLMAPFALGDAYALSIPAASAAAASTGATFATPKASPSLAALASPSSFAAAAPAVGPASAFALSKGLWLGDFELPSHPAFASSGSGSSPSASASAASSFDNVHHLAYADSYDLALSADMLEPLPDTRIAAVRSSLHPYARPAASAAVKRSGSRSPSPAASAAAALAFRGGVSPSGAAGLLPTGEFKHIPAASSSHFSPAFGPASSSASAAASLAKVKAMDTSADDAADADDSTALVAPAPLTSSPPASIATAHGASFVGRIHVTKSFAWPKVARPSKEAHMPFTVTYASGERVAVSGFVLRLVNETGMRGQGGWVPRPGREVITRHALHADARGHVISLLVEPLSPSEDEDKKLRLAYGLAVAKEVKASGTPDHVGYLTIDPARPGSGTSFRVTVFAEAPVAAVSFGAMTFNERFTSLLGSTVALDLKAASSS